MTKGQGIAIAVGAAALALAGVIVFSSSSKDTPIVVAGGSIYGDTHLFDGDGWKRAAQGDPYAGSIHGPGKYNPNGIGSITLTGFDGTPPQPMTVTNSWAISFSNVDEKSNEKPWALRLCSDATCSASQFLMNGSPNTQLCSVSFNNMGPVYIGVRSDSRLQEHRPVFNQSKVDELRFHDGTSGCDGANDSPESSCDTIYKIRVEICAPPPPPIPSPTDYLCKNNKKCKVQIGHSAFN